MRDAPEVLFIQIARFERTKRGRSYRKCNNEVIVPEILDMMPFLEESEKPAGIESRYRLCGTINHAGTMGSGHFVSHVRGQNRHWYRLDDETVTDSSIATLNNDPLRFGKHKFTPYVLAYTKVFDDDLAPDPPRAPTPPACKTVRLRVKVDIARGGHVLTMTRRIKGFATLDDQTLSMQIDIVDADGNSVLHVEPITFQLVRAALESGCSREGNPNDDLPKTPRRERLAKAKADPNPTGLVSPSPTPTKMKTRTTRSKGEEKARVGRAKSV